MLKWIKYKLRVHKNFNVEQASLVCFSLIKTKIVELN